MLTTSIAPWLAVRGCAAAIEFYRAAFSATEVYRMSGPDGSIVARLSVDGAEFWVADESPAQENLSPQSSGAPAIRMILTVPDPDAVFAQALAAGAFEIYPVGEEHGWRIGRVADPFGHQWEIGRPTAPIQ